MNEDQLPNPRPPLQHPPLMDLSFAALGWLNRAVQAVGSERFAETVWRTGFYIDRAEEHVFTPSEQAIIEGLRHGLALLIVVDVQARTLLAESCAGMLASDAAEFVELVENGD